MLQVEMAATIRKSTGKGAMRQLRMKGMTPAVVYGGGNEAIALELETQPFFQKLLKIYGKNAVVTLSLDDGTTKNVLVKDVQTDPIKDTLVHADFLEIDVNATRVFEVPINFQGTPKGVDLGGIMVVAKDSVAIEATPLNVPEEFTLDVSKMNIGDRIFIESIDIPESLTVITDPKDVCISVVLSKRDAAEDEEDTEEAVAPATEEPAAE